MDIDIIIAHPRHPFSQFAVLSTVIRRDDRSTVAVRLCDHA